MEESRGLNSEESKTPEMSDDYNEEVKTKDILKLIDDLVKLFDWTNKELTKADLEELNKGIDAAKNKFPNELYAEALEIAEKIKKISLENEMNNTYNQLVKDLMKLRASNIRNGLENEEKTALNERINEAKKNLPEKKYEEAEKEVDRLIKENIPFENGKIEDHAYTVMMDNMIKLADPNNNNDDENIKKIQEKIEKARQVLPKEWQKKIEDSVQQKFPEKQQNTEKERNSFSSSKDDNQTERKTLQQIMYELQKGLEIKAKSGKRYQASNIKIGKNFKNELKSGNVWYNVVHFGPTLIKSAVAGIKKLTSKFNLWKTEQTHTMDILKDRVDNLNDRDLQVIWEEYRGSQVNQDSFTSALNIMLNDKIQRFANSKVSEINTKIAAGYNQIFGDYQVIKEINKQLENSEISTDQRKKLEARKQSLLNTKAQEIGDLRKLYIQGNNYYSGGAHGFSEDMKAAGTNLSKVGKRFAVKHDYDDELQARKAKLEMLEANAVRNGDNEQALEAFVQYEGLKSDETEINRSILRGGDRSTGKMYYSPLVGQLDYRDDPFIRDVFTTIAMVGSAISVVNSIHTHVTETNEVLAAEQAKAAQVNGTNQSTIDQVHQTGQDITSQRDVIDNGYKALAQNDNINTLNIGERGASTTSVNSGGGWSSGSVYREVDEIAHATAKKAYETSQQQIQDIATQYSQGILSQAQVTEKLAEMATISHQTLQGVIQNSLPHFKTYMQNHPQFELAEVGKAMDYLVQNPNAIPDMYKAAADIVNKGEILTGLTIEQVEAIQSLPSDMFTTLMGAASSAALAYNCAKSTRKNRSSAKSEQEQQIITMVSEYQASQQTQEETMQKSV